MKTAAIAIIVVALVISLVGCLHIRYRDTIGSRTTAPLPGGWTYHKATMSDGSTQLRLLDPGGKLWRYNAEGKLVECEDEQFSPKGGAR